MVVRWDFLQYNIEASILKFAHLSWCHSKREAPIYYFSRNVRKNSYDKKMNVTVTYAQHSVIGLKEGCDIGKVAKEERCLLQELKILSCFLGRNSI